MATKPSPRQTIETRNAIRKLRHPRFPPINRPHTKRPLRKIPLSSDEEPLRGRLVRRPARPGDGRDRFHGEGARGEAPPDLPQAGHRIPADTPEEGQGGQPEAGGFREHTDFRQDKGRGGRREGPGEAEGRLRGRDAERSESDEGERRGTEGEGGGGVPHGGQC